MPECTDSLDLSQLAASYCSGKIRPIDVISTVPERTARRGDDKVWIDRVPREQLEARVAELENGLGENLPLYGIPFAIKDNVDLAGRPTSAACPDFSYTPETSASVVQRLIDAGAIALGKTNLDQFAIGLVGTHAPYGACANAFLEVWEMPATRFGDFVDSVPARPQ